MMRQKIVDVTPRIADAWLRKNKINRDPRATVIDTYATAMRRGEWKLSPQGIAFDEDGNLQDGQHRLEAVKLSGVTVKMVVWEGCPPETFQITDLGLKRTVGDVLGESKDVAAIGNFFAKMCEADLRGSITPQIAMPYIVAVRPYVDNLLNAGNKTVSKSFSAAAVRCAAITRIADGDDAYYVRGVYHALNARDFEAMPPIARALYKQHLDGVVRGGTDIYARCLTAFNKSKSDMRRLQVMTTDAALAYGREVFRAVLDGKEKARTKAAPKFQKAKRDFIAA